jgi:hypothetical protein
VSGLPPPLGLGRPGTELRRQLVHAVLRGERTAAAGDGPPPRRGDRLTLRDVDDLPVGVVEVTQARAGEVHFRLTDLVVARRFRGPQASGNGGYTSGLLAGLLGGSDVEVTLRTPPPLETPLRIDGHALRDGDTLVAEARPASVELQLPEPIVFAAARALEAPPDPDHPFPGCFTCGPEGDGLRLRPTPVGDGRVVAAWRPSAPAVEHVWAALDCPGAYAVNPDGSRGLTLLGRLAAHVEEVPQPGEELVVVGWPLPGGDERRFHAGTALFRGTTALAWARATWFAVGGEARDALRSGP